MTVATISTSYQPQLTNEQINVTTTSQSQTTHNIEQHQLEHSFVPLTQPSLTAPSNHDINRVTILQTTNTSQVCTPNGVNIVAILPGTSTVSTTTTQTQFSNSTSTSLSLLTPQPQPQPISSSSSSSSSLSSSLSNARQQQYNNNSNSNGIQILALI